jgi:nucleoside-diphosphate-sugar epimerase
MKSPILVTGGTGTLGRLVVRRLRDAGCDVRVLSRRSHEAEDGIWFLTGDVATGEGIEAAVDGVAAIAHCAGNAKGDAELTRNPVRAASSQPAPASRVQPAPRISCTCRSSAQTASPR